MSLYQGRLIHCRAEDHHLSCDPTYLCFFIPDHRIWDKVHLTADFLEQKLNRQKCADCTFSTQLSSNYGVIRKQSRCSDNIQAHICGSSCIYFGILEREKKLCVFWSIEESVAKYHCLPLDVMSSLFNTLGRANSPIANWSVLSRKSITWINDPSIC